MARYHRLTVNDFARQGDIYSRCSQFFGLRQNPFDMRRDPSWLLLNHGSRCALNELANGISAGKGLLLLTGEVGTGKTTLLKCLRQWLDRHRIPTAFIFNPHLEPNELFEWVLVEFGVCSNAHLKGNARQRLNQWLVEQHRSGVSPVLIIDEAQGLSSQALEEVRLLLNQETLSERLLQILLCGQPELSDRLRLAEMRQIRQRIEVRSRTSALDRGDVDAYIQARLGMAGASGTVFQPEAVDAIHFYSGGILRVVNLLCEHTMLQASTRKSRSVSSDIVEAVARSLGYDELKPVGGTRNRLGSEFQVPTRVPSLEAQELVLSAALGMTSTEAATSDCNETSRSALSLGRSAVESLDGSSRSSLEDRSWTKIDASPTATATWQQSQNSVGAVAHNKTPAVQRALESVQRLITTGKETWNNLSFWLLSQFRVMRPVIRSTARRPRLKRHVAALLEWMNEPIFEVEHKVRVRNRQ